MNKKFPVNCAVALLLLIPVAYLLPRLRKPLIIKGTVLSVSESNLLLMVIAFSMFLFALSLIPT